MKTHRPAAAMTFLFAMTLLIAAAPLHAAVKDGAQIFSSQAVDKATSVAQELNQKFGKELLIETFKEVPADRQDKLTADNHRQFFDEWGNARAKELKVNGIYVLICMSPSYIQAEVGQDTRKRAFTVQDRDELVSLLREHFRKKEYDQGLIASADFVRQRMQANLGNQPKQMYQTPGQPTPNQPGPHGFSFFTWALIIGGVVVFFWIISRLGRRTYMSGAGGYPQGGYPMGGYPPGGGPVGYPPPSGGGFGRGVLGGLLGGMAGGWLYDKMGRRDGGSASGGPNYGPPSGGSDVGGDYSGGGGSFGDTSSSGGADFSGGPEAGGGGDSGGGGGDSGGSGGDF